MNDLHKQRDEYESVLKCHRRELDVSILECMQNLEFYIFINAHLKSLQVYTNTKTKCQQQLEQAQNKQRQLMDEKSKNYITFVTHPFDFT